MWNLVCALLHQCHFEHAHTRSEICVFDLHQISVNYLHRTAITIKKNPNEKFFPVRRWKELSCLGICAGIEWNCGRKQSNNEKMSSMSSLSYCCVVWCWLYYKMIRDQTFYDYLIFLSYFSFWPHFSRFSVIFRFHFCVLQHYSLVAIIWSIRCRYGFKCCGHGLSCDCS